MREIEVNQRSGGDKPANTHSIYSMTVWLFGPRDVVKGRGSSLSKILQAIFSGVFHLTPSQTQQWDVIQQNGCSGSSAVLFPWRMESMHKSR